MQTKLYIQKTIAFLFFALSLVPVYTQDDWPKRPINLIVMYAPGGGTDTILRTLAAEISNVTGWRINVINRPGASGAVATRYVLNQESDGYTWLGSSNFNKYSRISGGSNSKSWEDWYYMQAASNTGSWAVASSSRFSSLDEIINYARAHPGEITVSTSGAGGQWHELSAAIASSLDIELRFIPYGSGRLAALAALSGEVDIAGGGIHEHIQFYEAGQLRPIIQSSEENIITQSEIILSSISSYMGHTQNNLPPNGSYNLGIKRDTPIEIINMIEEAFVLAVNSENFMNLINERYFEREILLRDQADERAALMEVISAQTFKDLDIPDSRSSTDLELPAPDNFDTWWPPENYQSLLNQ